MTINQRCIITIEGKKDCPTEVSAKVEWVPKLDMKDEHSNHPAVVNVALKFLNGLNANGETSIKEIGTDSGVIKKSPAGVLIDTGEE